MLMKRFIDANDVATMLKRRRVFTGKEINKLAICIVHIKKKDKSLSLLLKTLKFLKRSKNHYQSYSRKFGDSRKC